VDIYDYSKAQKKFSKQLNQFVRDMIPDEFEMMWKRDDIEEDFEPEIELQTSFMMDEDGIRVRIKSYWVFQDMAGAKADQDIKYMFKRFTYKQFDEWLKNHNYDSWDEYLKSETKHDYETLISGPRERAVLLSYVDEMYGRHETVDYLFFVDCIDDEPDGDHSELKDVLMKLNFGSMVIDW